MDMYADPARAPPADAARAGMSAFLYDAEGHDREVPVEPGIMEQLHDSALLWVDVLGRGEADIGRAAEALGLTQSSVRELLNPRPTLRIDNYGGYLQFGVFVSPGSLRAGAAAETSHELPAVGEGHSRLDFLVGENWVLTVHEEDVQCLVGFRGQDKAETQIGTLSAAALTASLLDWHLEAFFSEVARVELVVDRLDEHVLSDPSADRLLGRILAVRRRISRLRRLLAAQRPVFYGLGRPDLALGPVQAATEHFQALASRFERAVDEVEHTRDLVVGSFELFTSRSAQQTNDLVRALTFFTVIIGCAAAVAGLFGMNFDPPFFKSGAHGFFAVTGGLALMALLAWIVGRRRRWI